MKQFLASILLTLYFFVSTGFVVSTHFCMNRIDSVQVGTAKSEMCGKCGMHTEDSKGCCRSEVKVLKLQHDPLPAKVLLASFAPTLVALLPSLHLDAPFYNFIQSDSYYNLKPPLLSKQETYLSNCVFRI